VWVAVSNTALEFDLGVAFSGAKTTASLSNRADSSY